MQKPELALRQCAFFAGFTDSALKTLGDHSTEKHYRKNTRIITMGEVSQDAYILLKGTAVAFTESDNGDEFVVNSFTAGDCFGELGVLDGHPRTASVATTSPCNCLIISGQSIMQCLQEEPSVALAIVRHLTNRMRHMTEDVTSLAMLDVYGRLVRVLENAVDSTDSDKVITHRLTHQDIANRIGASREMVTKLLKDLKTGKYIQTTDHRIEIVKPLPDRW